VESLLDRAACVVAVVAGALLAVPVDGAGVEVVAVGVALGGV